MPRNNELNWLYDTTKNISINYLEGQNKNFNVNSLYKVQDSQKEIIELIDKDYFNSLIDNIDDISKEVVSLKIFSKFSYREIGDLLNMFTICIIWEYYKIKFFYDLLISNLKKINLTNIK